MLQSSPLAGDGWSIDRGLGMDCVQQGELTTTTMELPVTKNSYNDCGWSMHERVNFGVSLLCCGNGKPSTTIVIDSERCMFDEIINRVMLELGPGFQSVRRPILLTIADGE